MEDIGSIFTDKRTTPDNKALAEAIGKTFPLWQAISEYVHAQYPKAKEEWKYPGAKYGWSFRINDNKRAIIYLLPRDQFFKVAFVFGEKATGAILKSDVSDAIKKELRSARVYGEGRGIRIDVKKKDVLKDVRFLIDTKLAN